MQTTSTDRRLSSKSVNKRTTCDESQGISRSRSKKSRPEQLIHIKYPFILNPKFGRSSRLSQLRKLSEEFIYAQRGNEIEFIAAAIDTLPKQEIPKSSLRPSPSRRPRAASISNDMLSDSTTNKLLLQRRRK